MVKDNTQKLILKTTKPPKPSKTPEPSSELEPSPESLTSVIEVEVEVEVGPPKNKGKKASKKKKAPKAPETRVTIQSLAVGARFEYEGILYRKAFPVDKVHQIGQKLVRHQFSATLLLGQARTFDPDTLVEPIRKP